LNHIRLLPYALQVEKEEDAIGRNSLRNCKRVSRANYRGIFAKDLSGRRFAGIIPALEAANEIPNEEGRRILFAVDAYTHLSDRAGRIRRADRYKGRTDPPRSLHYCTKLFRGTNHENTSMSSS
jgi:hypothetical protein